MSLVTVPKRLIQIVIDAALHGESGMSGWMSDEEVDGLRALAVAAGMDPMDATPVTFRCKHRGEHAWGEWKSGDHYYIQHGVGTTDVRRCNDCGKYDSRPTPKGVPGTFNLDDFVEILSGPNAGELGCVATVDQAGRFGVRNMAGHRGHYRSDELRLVSSELPSNGDG